MINRRHIRLKVMQSLYAYFSKNEDDIKISEKSMLTHINQVVELYFLLFSILIKLIEYTDEFLEQGKKKHFPTMIDLNPNTRFVNNEFSQILINNQVLRKKTDKLLSVWVDNDHDIINKLFKELYQSNLYDSYINNKNQDISIDQRFIAHALNEHILNHELVHHIIEENSIYWLDDLPFVAATITHNIKYNNITGASSVFKDSSDKEFAVKLFRETIKNNQLYEGIIIDFADNWELDRIAIMDQLLLKMAFTEILKIKDLPVKVSMNEYIEISKYYSTKKSKMFVNGILDNAVKYFKKKGQIKKSIKSETS